MNTTYELNNLRKDSDFLNREMRATSVVAEVFSAMVNGNEVGLKSLAIAQIMATSVLSPN